MSFIGNVPAESYTSVVKDTFSGNDSTTDFTLSIPATTNSVEVFVENVQQEPTDAYTISGTTLSFTAAPVTGTDNIYVIHRGPAVQQVVPPAGVAIDASTVTASGNVLVGTTSTTPTTSNVAGNAFLADGGIRVSRDAGTSQFNRKNSNGPIAQFYKDGSLVGAIGTENTHVYLVGQNRGIRTDTNQLNPVDSSGATTDGVYNIGTSSTKFNDIHLAGNAYFNSGFGSSAIAYGCRAWVNFNGTGTPSIRASGNVSSITDNGVGDYTVNFTTAMPDNDYSVSTFSGNDGATSRCRGQTTGASFGTGSVSIRNFDLISATTLADDTLICVQVVR